MAEADSINDFADWTKFFIRLRRPRMRYVFTCLLVLALGAFQSADDAKAASIEGTWNGGGTVKLASGGVEKVRCRIRYEKSTGRTFVIHVTCSHANGSFRVSGRIVKLSANSYSGSLYSDQYSVSGNVGIRVSGTRQTVTAKSAKGTATVTLTKR